MEGTFDNGGAPARTSGALPPRRRGRALRACMLLLCAAAAPLPALPFSISVCGGGRRAPLRQFSTQQSEPTPALSRGPQRGLGARPACGGPHPIPAAGRRGLLALQGKKRDSVGEGLREREVVLGGKSFYVIEAAETSSMVDDWIDNQMATVDPFGVVLWPAAQVLSGIIQAEELDVQDKSVLEVGCGTGLCSLVAARAGAVVTSTDTNPLPLRMLEMAAERQGLTLSTSLLDIEAPEESLPQFDVLIAADCMYNTRVAQGLARLCAGAAGRGVALLVADSVNIARDGFQDELERLGCAYEIDMRRISFTGSAVGIDMDVERETDVAVYVFGSS